MSNEFLQPSEELKRVAEEISALRRDLQATSSSLGRIEKRLKASFPNYPTKAKQGKKPRATAITDKSSEELNDIFSSLVDATKANGDSGFERAASNLDDAVLLAVAIEIGAGTASSLTLPKAKKSIRSRVQEALQLQFQPKRNTEPDGGLNDPSANAPGS